MKLYVLFTSAGCDEPTSIHGVYRDRETAELHSKDCWCAEVQEVELGVFNKLGFGITEHDCSGLSYQGREKAMMEDAVRNIAKTTPWAALFSY